MYAEIKLNTAHGEERTVPMLATASTPIRYKMLFGKDLMTGLISTVGDSVESMVDVVSELAFLMAQQAAKVDLTALDKNKYIEWLDEFDSAAFINNSDKIFNVYISSRNNTSKAKK